MKNSTKSITKNLVISIVLFLVLAGVLSMYTLSGEEPKQVEVSAVVDQIGQEKVKSIAVKGDKLEIELTDGSKEVSHKESGDTLSTLLSNYKVDPEKMRKISVDIKQESGLAFWLGALLPFLVPFALVSFFIYFMMRQVQGANTRAMSFGQ